MRPYDEEEELTRYVLTHFVRLLTGVERKVLMALDARTKALPRESRPENRVLRRWEGWDDPEVSGALADGPEVFRHRVRRRVIEQHPDEAIISRCPRCQRVVATPRAQQCLWCGHDWHR
jgi:hypothetical protein